MKAFGSRSANIIRRGNRKMKKKASISSSEPNAVGQDNTKFPCREPIARPFSLALVSYSLFKKLANCHLYFKKGKKRGFGSRALLRLTLTN